MIIHQKLIMSMPENVIGIFLMVGMVIVALLLSGLVKLAGSDIDFRIIMAGRFLFSLPLIYFIAWRVRGKNLFLIQSKLTLFGRISIGLIGICLWFSAIKFADFGQVTALAQSSAVFITLLAPIFLFEKIGIWRVGAVFMGLFGVVLITNPFNGPVSIGIFLAILSAITSAILSILLRKLGKSDEPTTVALWHNTIGTVIFILSLTVNTPQNIIFDKKTIFILLGLGICGSLLQLSFTYAFKFGEAVVLAPIRYLAVPGAVIIGFLIWDEIPAKIEIIGCIITILSCLVITWREILKKKNY